MTRCSLLAGVLLILGACAGSSSDASDPEPAPATAGSDAARSGTCPYVGPDETCLPDYEAACDAYGCAPETCRCTEATTRNTCVCAEPPPGPCTYLGPDDECIDDFAAACAAYGCADDACQCTEATTRNTCSCRPVP